MPIVQAESDKLEFDFYFFLDDDWRDGIAASEGEVESWLDGAALWRGRGTLSESTAMDWLEMLTSGEAYTTYKVGQRPQSIPEEHWRHMIRGCSLTSGEVTEGECSLTSNEGKCNQSETDQTGIC